MSLACAGVTGLVGGLVQDPQRGQGCFQAVQRRGQGGRCVPVMAGGDGHGQLVGSGVVAVPVQVLGTVATDRDQLGQRGPLAAGLLGGVAQPLGGAGEGRSEVGVDQRGVPPPGRTRGGDVGGLNRGRGGQRQPAREGPHRSCRVQAGRQRRSGPAGDIGEGGGERGHGAPTLRAGGLGGPGVDEDLAWRRCCRWDSRTGGLRGRGQGSHEVLPVVASTLAPMRALRSSSRAGKQPSES